ncbi:MAG: hypothetical protein ACKOAU_02380, partial [Pirellula sp.]
MFALVWKQGGAEVGVQLPKYLIFAFFALGALVLYLWSRFGYRDMKSIAECIEKRHPELDQKLLTAIEPPKPNESEFLRRKLVEQTLAHAQKKDWEQIVPSGRLAALWGVQWLLLLVALSIPLMIAGKKTSNGESAGVKADKLDDWLIEPGDIQLEKGSDLLISVRFPDSFTDDLNMVATGPDGQSQVIRLQRSLKDPIASATLRRVKDSLRYRIESESKSSEMFNVEVFEHPGVVHSGALIQSPAYAKQEDKTISNTRRVSVVDGANIIWSLKLNKPVATAQWIDENGLETSLEPESDDPTAFRIASSPKGSGRYRLRLVDAQGRTEKGAEEFIVKVIPNREPELQLISASDQRVSPIQEMLVDAKVQDDFGIHRAGISVFVGDSEAQEIELKSSSNESSKKTELHHLIDLESLSAKADQLVTYHFWSEDLDRDGQPRRIDGEMFFAEVRPFEELFREGDSSATQQRQQQQEQQQ